MFTKLSRVFAPTLTHPPALGGPQSVSPEHALLLQGGYVRQTSAGVFAYLPLAHRVMRNIAMLIEARMDEIGAQQMQLPALTRADLWRRSGRLALMKDEVTVALCLSLDDL
jgi:prolyl-tRNA synthetase